MAMLISHCTIGNSMDNWLAIGLIVGFVAGVLVGHFAW